MKHLLIAAIVGAFLMIGSFDSPAASRSSKKDRGSLVHMVAFKFKDTASPADIKRVETAFAELPAKIPQIVSFEWGTNNSPEKLDKGFTHGFVLTFKSAKDRDDYLVHPDHKAFGAIVGPVLADVFVLDFESPAPAKKSKKSRH